MARKKAVKKKVEIVFDPEKRKEFLTGFQKRKNERRKKAQEELERNLKEERKRIRQEVKDGIKHMKKSFEPLKELSEADKVREDEYEDDEVKVKIVELSTNELAAQHHLLGANRAAESEESEGPSEVEEDVQDTNRIPGMDLEQPRKRRRPNEDATLKKKPRLPQDAAAYANLNSKKDIDRLKKDKTMKQLKKSKVFKMKERLDKKANLKKAKRNQHSTLKSLPRYQQRKKKNETPVNRYRKGRMLNKRTLRKQQQH